MKKLFNAIVIIGVIAILGWVIMGNDRSGSYVKGTRKVAQKHIDESIPTEVKIEGLKADIRGAEELSIEMVAEAAVTKGQATVMDRKCEELTIAISKLEMEVENGKMLLIEKRDVYLINGTEYTLQELLDIVRKKAETLKAYRDDLNYIKDSKSNSTRMGNIQAQWAEELGRNIDREKRALIRMQDRHQVAKATANVARKTAMLGELNDPFSDAAHVEIYRSVERDISILEAQNRHAFIGTDIYGDEVDLTTLGSEQDWQSIIDQIDYIAGNKTKSQSEVTTNDLDLTVPTVE